MAHLDFRQAFSSPGDRPHPILEPAPAASAAEETTDRKEKRTLSVRLPRLQQSYQTTFLFAVLTFVGGLFCAFFFFDGSEILHAATAWSREFLYPRPPALIASDGIDNASPNAQADSESPAQSRSSEPREANRTAPFSRDLGSLYPRSFNNPSGGTGTLAPGSGSLLSDLNVPAPGGDALLQSFNQAVENIARAANLFANSTATVVKTTVVQTPSKANSLPNSVRQTGDNIVSGTAAQTKQASSVASRTQTRATSSALNLRNNLGQGLGGVSGLGDAAGNLGAGGLGGAAGGAMGGIGGMGGVDIGMGGH